MKKKLFQKLDDGERRDLRIPVRVNAQEKEAIEHAADIREMGAGEFLRRAGLGRKADVRYETKIVLSITELVLTIRTINATLVEFQATPNLDVEALQIELRAAVAEAKAALLRIEA